MWQHEYGAKYVCRRWLKFLLLNRIDWYEAWAHWTGCKMSAGDCQFFSSALLSNPAQSCKNQGSSIKILLYYVSDMCLWLYALVRPVWSEFLLLEPNNFVYNLLKWGTLLLQLGFWNHCVGYSWGNVGLYWAVFISVFLFLYLRIWDCGPYGQ